MFNYNPNYNPYNMPVPTRAEVIEIDGKEGALSYPLGRGCSALMLDRTASLVWYVMSDDVGYKTAKAYKIEPAEPEAKPAEYGDIINRLERLEAIVNEQSDSHASKNKSD